jgi:HAD superfamily hydrolase (TIGR01484 family)
MNQQTTEQAGKPRVPKPGVLATDLDGTLIPLDGNEQNRRDLILLGQRLRAKSMPLVYVTGRHLTSVQDAIKSESLPIPSWIVADVGTSMYVVDSKDDMIRSVEYTNTLADLIADYPIAQLNAELSAAGNWRLQEPEKQGRFKLSFYCEALRIDEAKEQILAHLKKNGCPYQLIASVDPFNGDGLLDLLPAGVSKAFAIDWWGRSQGWSTEQILFVGDSGNDVAALTAGFRSIVVSNAALAVANSVQQVHDQNGWTNRLFLATKPATSGVLEGVLHFDNEFATNEP